MCRNLSYYCLLAPHIYIFVLRAHPVRGESHNQPNATGEVATLPSLLLPGGKIDTAKKTLSTPKARRPT